MSWSRPLLILAMVALGPSACGFHPLYGQRDSAKAGSVNAQMAAIRVEMIEDRAGQKLRNELISRLNPRGEPVAAKYILSVVMAENTSGLAHSSDGTATLAELNLTASFSLSAGSGHGGGTSGLAQAVVSTDFLGPRYASVAAERDAEDRAIAQIADKIVGQIAVYINDPASRPPIQPGQPMQGAPLIQHYQVLQGLPPTAAPDAASPVPSAP